MLRLRIRPSDSEMIPKDIQNIIWNYIDEILLSEKLDFCFSEFIRHFGYTYAPISEGLFPDPPSIYNNFETSGTYAAMGARLKKAEVMFNRYCWTMTQAAIQPEHWIEKAMTTIQWSGVAIMFRETKYELIKLHGEYLEDGVLSPNGFTMIDFADFAHILGR